MQNLTVLIKHKKFSVIILGLIILLALILRLVQLSSVPPSPDWDEVALGYDAYSIMHTGRDEFGNFLPVVLRSFDDYKPALYVYLAIPSVAVFGLTTFAVRFPSVVMGIIGISAFYFLVKELFEKRGKTQNSTQNYAEILALLSAFLLTIAPWHLQFSRAAFETSVGLTVNLFVALCFLKGLKKPWWLHVAGFLAGLNLAVYQSERVFTPLLLLALILIYRKALFAIAKKYLVTSLLIAILAVLPTLLFIVQNSASLERVNATSIFSQGKQFYSKSIFRIKVDTDQHDRLGQVVDNRRMTYASAIVSGYLAHFDSNWLFIEGDNPRHHAPQMGLLLLLGLPFLLIGVYQLLFAPFDKRTKYVVFSWLLLAPIPAAVTIDVPHAVRTMNMLPALLVLSAIGFIAVYKFIFEKQESKIKNQGLRFSFIFIFVLLALFNISYFLNQYFVQQNYFSAVDWRYGYAQAIPQIEQLKKNYRKVVVSDTNPLDRSYMFFLFYLRYPPQQYQQIVAKNPNSWGHHFDSYEFRSFQWVAEKDKKDVLYVGSVKDFPSGIRAKKTILYPDGTPAMLFVDPKDNL